MKILNKIVPNLKSGSTPAETDLRSKKCHFIRSKNYLLDKKELIILNKYFGVLIIFNLHKSPLCHTL